MWCSSLGSQLLDQNMVRPLEWQQGHPACNKPAPIIIREHSVSGDWTNLKKRRPVEQKPEAVSKSLTPVDVVYLPCFEIFSCASGKAFTLQRASLCSCVIRFLVGGLRWAAFSALTLLVGRQEGHLACKNWVVRCWRGYVSGARCKWFAYGPADATATPSSVAPVKSRMVYFSGAGLHRLSWKKGRWNGCSSSSSGGGGGLSWRW